MAILKVTNLAAERRQLADLQTAHANAQKAEQTAASQLANADPSKPDAVRQAVIEQTTQKAIGEALVLKIGEQTKVVAELVEVERQQEMAAAWEQLASGQRRVSELLKPVWGAWHDPSLQQSIRVLSSAGDPHVIQATNDWRRQFVLLAVKLGSVDETSDPGVDGLRWKTPS